MTSQQTINMFSPYMSSRAIERASEVLHTPMIGQGALVDEFEQAYPKGPGVVICRSG